MKGSVKLGQTTNALKSTGGENALKLPVLLIEIPKKISVNITKKLPPIEIPKKISVNITKKLTPIEIPKKISVNTTKKLPQIETQKTISVNITKKLTQIENPKEQPYICPTQKKSCKTRIRSSKTSSLFIIIFAILLLFATTL